MAYMPVGDPIREQYRAGFQFLALTVGIWDRNSVFVQVSLHLMAVHHLALN